jgi:hypothetical protein
VGTPKGKQVSMGVIQNILLAAAAMTLSGGVAFSAELPTLIVGEREVIATKEQRDALGLKSFNRPLARMPKRSSQSIGNSFQKMVYARGLLSRFCGVEPC